MESSPSPAKINLLGLDRQAMENFFVSLGEKPYRATQAIKSIHFHGLQNIQSITNFSKPLREKIAAVAEILNNSDRGLEASILEGIEGQRETLADEIRRLMFVFEDLMGVDDRGVQAILKEVSTDDLKLALKLASEDLKTKIFGAMSSRAVEMLKEDMEIMGPTRVKDVEGAQQAIIKIAKRLEQEGKIQLMSGGGGEDEFV